MEAPQNQDLTSSPTQQTTSGLLKQEGDGTVSIQQIVATFLLEATPKAFLVEKETTTAAVVAGRAEERQEQEQRQEQLAYS